MSCEKSFLGELLLPPIFEHHWFTRGQYNLSTIVAILLNKMKSAKLLTINNFEIVMSSLDPSDLVHHWFYMIAPHFFFNPEWNRLINQKYKFASNLCWPIWWQNVNLDSKQLQIGFSVFPNLVKHNHPEARKFSQNLVQGYQ